MVRVLIADDDSQISYAIVRGLEGAGIEAVAVGDGKGVFQEMKTRSYSVLLLDIMLPGMSGFDVCKQLRENRFNIPILMLTARDSLQDRVTGLDVGADDYLPKPFAFQELLARVRALTRRHSMIKSTEIKVADLHIHCVTREVRRSGKEIVLTPKEFNLLEALAMNSGNVLSKETIADNVWLDSYTMPNTVEVHVKNLRRKIDEGFSPKLIHTVYGIGYTLKASE